MLREDGLEWALGLDGGVGNLVWIDSVALLGVWRERESRKRILVHDINEFLWLDGMQSSCQYKYY